MADFGHGNSPFYLLIHLTCDTAQSVESTSSDDHEDKSDSDDDDIEAQIRKEVEGLKPSASKSRPFHAIRMDLPCCA